MRYIMLRHNTVIYIFYIYIDLSIDLYLNIYIYKYITLRHYTTMIIAHKLIGKHQEWNS